MAKDDEPTTPSHGSLAETVELQPTTRELPVVDSTENPGKPPKKKHRLRTLLITLVVLAIVVVVAWFVVDNLAREWAKNYIRETITTSFDLPADQPMQITIGPGSLIAQAIGGSIDSVDVALDDVPLGDLNGDITLALTGIPLDETQPVDTLRVGLTVDEENVQKLSTYLSDADLTQITLEGDEIAVGTSFNLFGADVPISLTLAPSAVDGSLAFAPSTISVNDTTISLTELRDGPFGGFAGDLLDSRTFCVAEYLPKAITLTDVSVEGDTLVLAAEGDNEALGGPDFTDLGTCE
ncbi:MAG: DUF2993 domain-containing protein [Glaciihabitans sp.]